MSNPTVVICKEPLISLSTVCALVITIIFKNQCIRLVLFRSFHPSYAFPLSMMCCHMVLRSPRDFTHHHHFSWFPKTLILLGFKIQVYNKLSVSLTQNLEVNVEDS